jgi:hypothetical protein
MVNNLMPDMLISVGLLIITIFLFLIVLVAYLRLRNKKMLFISLGFGTIFVGAVLHLLEIIFESINFMITENILLLFQLIGLFLIAIGVLKD